jgi:hypothetical protein
MGLCTCFSYDCPPRKSKNEIERTLDEKKDPIKPILPPPIGIEKTEAEHAGISAIQEFESGSAEEFREGPLVHYGNIV